jgi:hypothetical protein
MKKTAVSESFMSRADSAAFWEAWVGACVSRMGLYTLHHPFAIDGKEHGESWDLDVHESDMSRPTKVEVKSQRQEFTCPSDFCPRDFIVCSQNNFMRKWPGASSIRSDFLFVSTVTGCIVWLPKGSEVSFGHETYDKQRGELFKTVKTSANNLKSFKEFCQHVKESV